MADEPTIDENGKKVWPQYKKVIEPRPHEEDLTRVYVGDGEDYVYVDATTLFQLERLVPLLRDCKNKSQRRDAGRGYPKYTRDIADQAEVCWPAAGYVVRLGAHLSDYDMDAAKAIAFAGAGPSDSELSSSTHLKRLSATAVNAETGEVTPPDAPLPEYPYVAAEHAEEMLESVFAAMAPELAYELDPEVEQAGAVPG